jgi:hypothetical protein
MNMRATCDPYGGLNPLVDKCIGPTAYHVVQYVAQNMAYVQRAAANTNIQKRLTTVLLFAAGGASIALPLDCTIDQVLSSSVMLKTPAGLLIDSDSGLFTTSIDATSMTLTLTPEATIALNNSEVRWFLMYGVPANA